MLTGATTRISGLPPIDGGRRVDTSAEDLQQVITGAGEKLIPGSTVTSRVRYKVAADGSLVVTDRKVTINAEEQASASDADGRRSSRRAFDQREQQTLASLIKPQPTLLPSDELALFAEASAPEAVVEPPRITRVSAGQATAEDGSAITVDIIRPGDAPPSDIHASEVQAQAFAASLYARNNDIVFTATPFTGIAA